MRYELFTALDLAGEPPRHPSEFDRLLKTALAERPRTFLVDEAQWLNGEAFEYFRYLWDEPPERPGQQLCGEVLEPEQDFVLRPGGAFTGARLAGVAGQRGQEHALHRPVQPFHRALEMRGVGGQVLHRHVQEIERGGHRPRQEVLATVHPHLLGHAAERTVGVLTQHSGTQAGQYRLPRRIPRRDRHTSDRVRRAVGEPRDPRPAGPALDIDQHRGLQVVGLPHMVTPGARPGQEHIVLARRPLSSRESGPLPRAQITADRPVQRRNRRRRLPPG
ncbi:ATP-binding protein [Streptomyces collinus]